MGIQATHEKIKSSPNYGVIKSIVSKRNDKISQKMMEKIFQNAGLGLFHEKLINSKVDVSSGAFRVSKGRQESKDNSEYFVKIPHLATYQ